MSSQGVTIEIKTVSDLRAAKAVEASLQQQIVAAKAAGAAYGHLKTQLDSVSGAIANKGFFGRATNELMGMAEQVPIVGSLMRSMNGGVGILSAGLVGLGAVAGVAKTALSSFSKIEDLQTSFVTLLGSVTAAKARMAELSKFAAETPFELPEVAQASKILQNLTGGALATGAGLRMVGDVAASANAPFQEVAVTLGRLYQGFRDGTPAGEAAMRMTELTGINLRQVTSWDQVTKALSKYNGEMSRRSETTSGKESTLSDSFHMLLAAMGKPIAPAYKDFLSGASKALEGFATTLSNLSSLFEKHGGAVKTFTGTVTVLAETFATKFVLDKIVAAVTAFTSRTVASAAAISAETLAIEANTVAKAENAVAGVAGGASKGMGAAFMYADYKAARAGGATAAAAAQAARAASAPYALEKAGMQASTIGANANAARLAEAGTKAGGMMGKLGAAVSTLTGPLGLLLIAVALGAKAISNAQKKDLEERAQAASTRLKTSSDFNKRAGGVDTQEKRDALVKEIEAYLESPEGANDKSGQKGLRQTIDRLRGKKLSSQAEYDAEWQRAEDDKSRKKIKTDLSEGLTDLANKKTFDALDDKGKLGAVNANLAAAQATVNAGGYLSVEQQEAAAKKILEYTQQRNELEAKIAESDKKAGQAKVDALSQASQDAYDQAQQRKAMSDDLAMKEAAGDPKKLAQIKWQQDYEKMLEDGRKAGMGDDRFNFAIRQANANMDKPDQQKNLEKSVVSAQHAVGTGRGEVYAAQDKSLSEIQKTNAKLDKSNEYLRQIQEQKQGFQ